MVRMIEFLAMGLFLLAPNPGNAASATLGHKVEIVQCGSITDAIATCQADETSKCCAIQPQDIEPAAGESEDVATTQTCEVWTTDEMQQPVCVTNYE